MDSCLSSSRFIAFFDECGDHSLSNINPQFPVFVLCVVVVERNAYARQIIPAMAEFKLRYFAHEGINLHSRDIRKAEGPFTILQAKPLRQRFIDELSELISSLPFTLFATVIRKDKHVGTYGDNAKNPYSLAMVYTFERILLFMEKNSDAALPVIAEVRGRNEDNELRASFHELMTQGTRYNDADRFRRLICPLSFRKKQDNIAGIQLADLCAYPIARYVLGPDQPNRAYKVVRDHFFKDGAYGLKVFPK